MLDDFALLEPKKKLAVLRAFFSLKQNSNYADFADFLDEVIEGTTANLRTLPLDQIARMQGKAQLALELKELFDMAKESEIHRLRNQV